MREKGIERVFNLSPKCLSLSLYLSPLSYPLSLPLLLSFSSSASISLMLSLFLTLSHPSLSPPPTLSPSSPSSS